MANASLTYRGNALLTTDTTTYTFSGSAIGDEHTYRAVLVFVTLSSLSGALVPSGTIDTVTINGVAATQLGYATSNSNMATAAFIARVTTGTSVDIVVTTTSIMTRCHIVWYTLKTASLTPIDTVFCTATSATDVSFTDVNIVNDGAVVVAMSLSATATQTVTYNGVDTLTSDYTSGLLDSSWYVASWSIRPTETIGTRDVFVSSASQRHYGIALSFGVQGTFQDELIDVVGVSPSDAPQTTYVPALADDAEFSDAARHTPVILIEDVVEDGVSTGDTLISTVALSIDEYAALIGVVGVPVPGEIEDTIYLQIAQNFSQTIGLSESASFTEVSLTYSFLPGSSLTDGFEIGVDLSAPIKFVAVVAESGGVRERLLVGVPVQLTETAAISLVSSVTRALRVAEQLQLLDVSQPTAKFHLTLQQSVSLTDSLRRFLSGEAVDAISTSDAIARLVRRNSALADGVTVAESITPKFLIRITATDTIGIADADVLKLLFRPTLTDGVEIAAGYVSPSGVVTTWAVNTKTMAVTEYTNFNFNSFTHMGHKYLGASSAGLYELNGDDDAGTDIIAQIKSGMMQLGGSRFSSFKSAYIGQRGEGDYVLKIETGDGKVYNYAVTGKDMQTARVHFGKGLRARYFSFELISTGQDFDLDTIEFIPLVVQRRV